jgi:NTP-dependent ternary system trypsin peptidase co-occuring protein
MPEDSFPEKAFFRTVQLEPDEQVADRWKATTEKSASRTCDPGWGYAGSERDHAVDVVSLKGWRTRDEVQIPLASAIGALRTEIVKAMHAAGAEDIRFALGPVELELQVEAAQEAGGEAGIKFWLVSIGGKGSRSSGTTHTVKLTLTPVRAAGGEPDVLVASDLEERD